MGMETEYGEDEIDAQEKSANDKNKQKAPIQNEIEHPESALPATPLRFGR